MPTRIKSGALSMTMKAYAALRRDILSCDIVPGQELSEGELAARFRMSKTPVREALAKLKNEGLVKTFPRRGYQVAPVTFQDMNELFEIRQMLEARAVELASARITDGGIARLAALSDTMYDPEQKPSIQLFVEANHDFHEAIALASGNARLHAMIVQVLDELKRFFYLGARLRNVGAETSDAHRLMIEAMGKRDGARARELMVEHNAETQKGLLLVLTQQGSSIMQIGAVPIAPPLPPSGAPASRGRGGVRPARRIASGAAG